MKRVWCFAVSAAAAFACGCGVEYPTTTLLDSIEQASQPAPIPRERDGCGAAISGIETTFHNSTVGSLISVTVEGPVESSRPQIEVVDFNGNVVAAAVASDSKAQTRTFTPATTTIFSVRVNECNGLVEAGLYKVLVTQAR